MQAFQDLGGLVERRWRDHDYSEECFPEIAASVLAESNASERIDPWDVIRWVHNAEALPEQQDVNGRFGDPPITIFCGSRFFIDVYYWLDGTTSIHQHSFSGAFQVLLGSSIHSRYSFREDKIVNEHFSVGQLALDDVQLLKQHDIRHILPGKHLIHSLFHLDRPSATLTIRTAHTPSASLQYDYRKPYFALNPFFKSPFMSKRIQTVSLLLGMKHPDADSLISDLVAHSDFHTTYFVLAETFRQLTRNPLDALFQVSSGRDRFNSILERARMRHGELADLVLPVLEEEERKDQLVARRSVLTSEEHRFFLALLLNIPNRTRILELVAHRFEDRDPIETILDWMEELANERVLGSGESNALGIDGFGDAHSLALEILLKEISADEITQSPEHLKMISNVGSSPERMREITLELERSPLLKPLFLK